MTLNRSLKIDLQSYTNDKVMFNIYQLNEFMFLEFQNNNVLFYANSQKRIFKLDYRINSNDVILMIINS